MRCHHQRYSLLNLNPVGVVAQFKVLDVDEERIIRRSAEMLGIKPSIVLQTKDQFKVE